MILSEMFGDPVYTVKRVDKETFEVSKFTDGKRPDATYVVSKQGSGNFACSDPSYHRTGQQDKHIKIVKQWLKDGEPGLAEYREENGKFVGTEF